MVILDCNNFVRIDCFSISLSDLFEYDVITRQPLSFLESGAVVCD